MATNLDVFQIIFKILATIGNLGLAMYFIFPIKMTIKKTLKSKIIIYYTTTLIRQSTCKIFIDIDNLPNSYEQIQYLASNHS
jgi:hypothetical protein